MIKKLQEYATGRLVLVLFIVTMAVYLIILFYSIPTVTVQAPEMKLFDMSPGGYDSVYAERLLSSIGSIGRDTYLKQQLPIDFLYPGLFGVTYTLMLVWLFKKRFDGKSKIFLLAFIPAFAGLFDYLENVGIILMLTSFPNINPLIVQISSWFTIVKSALTIGFYLLLLFGFLMLVVKPKRV